MNIFAAAQTIIDNKVILLNKKRVKNNQSQNVFWYTKTMRL